MDEELLSRQQPQSLEAEQAVLGSILIDSRCITDVVGIVKPEDFYLQQNREIYEAIYTMFNFSQTIDPVTVLDKLKELGYYHDNSRDYILQLMEITPTAANVARYAAIVQEKSMLRGLNQAATDIQQMVSEEVGTPAEMLESAEKKIYALRKGERGDSLEHIGTTLHKVFDRLTELSQSDSLIPGLSTGLRDLDTRINGLNKSDLHAYRRPARHGQVRLCAEHRRQRGEKVRENRCHFQSGNVPGAAGHASACQRGLCGAAKAGHGQAQRGRVEQAVPWPPLP